MGAFPPAILIAIGASRLFLAYMAGVAPEYLDLDPCDDWTDIFDGCAGIGGALFGFVLGTIPGLPALLNGLQIFVVTALLLWSGRQFVSGVG